MRLRTSYIVKATLQLKVVNGEEKAIKIASSESFIYQL
jgi:hypothetical protein